MPTYSIGVIKQVLLDISNTVVDNQLDKLGAQRVIERQECDGNTDGSIEWSEKFLALISK